jgi:tripartite-type tricarboxylate transporter receptor subunit TctC
MKVLSSALAVASIVLTAPAALAQQSPEAFYKGRTVSVYIGFSAGGTYDYFGRLIARHIGKHIPGNPTVVAQAMPGAGSLTLANWMFKLAPRDGTAMGIVAQTVAVDEALKSPGIQYKSSEFNWIGRATSNTEISLVWHTSKAKTMADAKLYDIPMASTGVGSPSESYLKLMNAAIGSRFKLIGPYPGSMDGLLAMEKGEVDGALTSWNTLNVAKHDWIVDKKVNILVQYSLERSPDMASVPTMVELGVTPEDKAMFAFSVSAGDIGRAFLAPPGVPADRIAALQKAFDETVVDPELLDEVRKAKLDFHPGTAARLRQIVADTANVPPAVVERMQSILQKK